MQIATKPLKQDGQSHIADDAHRNLVLRRASGIQTAVLAPLNMALYICKALAVWICWVNWFRRGEN
jgi:hypothetical protein